MTALSPERLKRADAWLWRPAALVGRVLAGAGAVRRRSGAPLIVRPGGMGDLICAQIAMEELGEDPRSALWLIERRSAGWATVQGLPFVAYDDGPRAVAGVLGRHRLVVNTVQRFGLSQALARAAVGRGGTLACFASNLAARHARIRVDYDPFDAHESSEFRRLLAAALGREAAPGPRARLRRTPSGGELLVGIAGRQSPSRDLGMGEWRSMVAIWSAGRPVTIAAAPVDRDFARGLAAALPDARVVEDGFGDLCDRIARAEAVFSVDGGMVHMASYFGVPTTAVFTSGRSAKWAPLGEGSAVVRRHDLACQPCTLWGQTPPCPHRFACKEMTGLVERRPRAGVTA